MNLTPGKGKKDGNCNVTRCQTPRLVLFYNSGTCAYYCHDCACAIRDACEEIKDELFPKYKENLEEYYKRLDE